MRGQFVAGIYKALSVSMPCEVQGAANEGPSNATGEKMMGIQKSVRNLMVAVTVGAAAALPLASHAATINGELTASSPVWDRRQPIDMPSPCGPGTQDYPYDSYPITHSGGTLTIEMKGISSSSGTLLDPYLYLYSGSFDPDSPCDNFLARNDDGGDGVDARISANYDAGDYVIVATTYDDVDDIYDPYGTYVLEYNSGITAVPTLNEWMLLLLGALVAGVGWLRFRRGKPV